VARPNPDRSARRAPARPAPARPAPPAPVVDVADLTARLAPLVEAVGLELFDVESVRAGTATTLRVSVDRTGGVDLDAVTAATRAVTPVLDELGLLERCTLEVSSPGLERPLRTREHYRRAVGTLITVKTSVLVDGARRHRGVLADVDDDGIALAPDGAPEGTTLRIPHEHVAGARTVFEWGPTAPPGRPATSSSERPTEARR
jgi:ribosome maturation factor RimP